MIFGPQAMTRLIRRLRVGLNALNRPLLFRRFIIFRRRFTSNNRLFFSLLRHLCSTLTQYSMIHFQMSNGA